MTDMTTLHEDNLISDHEIGVTHYAFVLLLWEKQGSNPCAVNEAVSAFVVGFGSVRGSSGINR